MDEAKIAQALQQWAKVDDAFCEELLQQCLAVLDQGDCTELEDEQLDMLAAAGNPFINSDRIKS